MLLIGNYLHFFIFFSFYLYGLDMFIYFLFWIIHQSDADQTKSFDHRLVTSWVFSFFTLMFVQNWQFYQFYSIWSGYRKKVCCMNSWISSFPMRTQLDKIVVIRDFRISEQKNTAGTYQPLRLRQDDVCNFFYRKI